MTRLRVSCGESKRRKDTGFRRMPRSSLSGLENAASNDNAISLKMLSGRAATKTLGHCNQSDAVLPFLQGVTASRIPGECTLFAADADWQIQNLLARIGHSLKTYYRLATERMITNECPE